ncbi:MAG: dTMP kinase [Anaerolineaceae bacterium]|nr:MAG: dTMP kinase [Anaerolineaceae bacterium]
MKKNSCPGKLTVLEGLDGAGTTTQSAELADWLRKYKGIKVWETREPSQGPAGAQIRSVLTGRLKMEQLTLAALFAADRLDHLYGKGGVIEHLNAGEWVIMDRYYLSSLAYQTLNVDDAICRWIWDLHESCITPDITLFLDVTVKTCMKRININRGQHFELFEKEDLLEMIRSQYLRAIHQLRQEGENIQILEGERPVVSVAKEVRERVKRLLLDEARLSAEEERTLWKEWPILSTIRKTVEEKANLTFLVVKKQIEGQQAIHGGYQLDFSGREKIYHIMAYLADNRTTMKIFATGHKDSTLDILKNICEPKSVSSIENLPLFPKEQ